MLFEGRIETITLHARFCSLVTVGLDTAATDGRMQTVVPFAAYSTNGVHLKQAIM